MKLALWCSNRCQNKSLCIEKLSLVLPETPPYFPRQFERCAVIGNSGDLLKTKFGKEIDTYDTVLRENGAPIQVEFFYLTSNSFVPSVVSLIFILFSLENLLAGLQGICGREKYISSS